MYNLYNLKVMKVNLHALNFNVDKKLVDFIDICDLSGGGVFSLGRLGSDGGCGFLIGGGVFGLLLESTIYSLLLNDIFFFLAIFILT